MVSCRPPRCELYGLNLGASSCRCRSAAFDDAGLIMILLDFLFYCFSSLCSLFMNYASGGGRRERNLKVDVFTLHQPASSAAMEALCSDFLPENENQTSIVALVVLIQ